MVHRDRPFVSPERYQSLNRKLSVLLTSVKLLKGQMFKVSNFCDIIVRSYVQGVRVRASNLCEIIEMSYVQCIRASNFFNFKTDEKSDVQRCPCSAST